MDTGAANTVAARAFVDELARLGVQDVCISPGSRSTPLTVAVAEHPLLHPWLHLDERTASFFAIGLARAKGAPVALVCTSGTAAANYHPAVAEADLSRVPIIVCTTDRPPRLRGVGAPQTINQVGMYGAAARLAVDAPVPAGDAAEPEAFRSLAREAVSAAMGLPPGPVHCNLPFEEPLIEAPGRHAPPEWDPASPGTASFATIAPSSERLAAARDSIARARRPLIIAGPETGGLPAAAIASLASHLDVPVMADVLSGLRTGNHDRSRFLTAHDVVVRRAPVSAQPDLVIRFGAIPTSKPLNGWLAGLGCELLLVDYPGAIRDPDSTATLRLDASPADAIAALLTGPAGEVEPGWCDGWVARDRLARESLTAAILELGEPFEGRVFVELDDLLPAGSTLALGNSMPVRDADSFFHGRDEALTIACNRGANGIDGVTSSALGASAARNGPVVLVTGDLSFEHDLTALWAAHRHYLDLTIVLVNNNGGGIFEFLPQAAHESFFEEWFGTPHGIAFQPAIEMYGGRYRLAENWDVFLDAVTDGVTHGGLSVVEVRTGRRRNVELHRQVWDTAAAAAWPDQVTATP